MIGATNNPLFRPHFVRPPSPPNRGEQRIPIYSPDRGRWLRRSRRGLLTSHLFFLPILGVFMNFPHMYNFSVFFCKGNEISSKEGDFLVETSAVSSFAIEGISGFWESECGSEKSFFGGLDSNSGDALGSEFFDEFCFGGVGFSEFLFRFNDVELFFMEEKVNTLDFFSSRLGLGNSFCSFVDLGSSEIVVDAELVSEVEEAGGGDCLFIISKVGGFCFSSWEGGNRL